MAENHGCICDCDLCHEMEGALCPLQLWKAALREFEGTIAQVRREIGEDVAVLRFAFASE